MALRRSLGLPALSAYGLGAILGAGIYSVIGGVAGVAGDATWLAVAASSGVALLTALSYAELSTMYPRAGAEFLYIRHALPRWGALAFAAGVMMATAAAATTATVALAFAGYLASFVPAPVPVVAPVLAVALAALAIRGVAASTGVVAVFTILEAIGLVVVVVAGATSDRFGDALRTAPTLDVIPGAALVFFSFLGFENIVNLAEESRRPARDLPRAILISLGAATALYVLVGLAVVALMSPAELVRSEAPLADAVRVRSPAAAAVLGGIALFATANTALAAIISGSRILYAMGRRGALPAHLARVHPRHDTPWVATLAVLGLVLALLPLGGVAVVASLSSFASLFAFAAVNASLIVLRYREPRHPRPFRVPGALGRLPVLPLAGAASTTLLLGQLRAAALVTGLVLLALALALYAARRTLHSTDS